MFTPVAIVFVTLVLAGQIGLTVLLLTLYFVPSLPQRANPFFVNMLLTMVISTLPSILLLVTGQQGGIKYESVCIVQSAMMDGIPPMWGSAVAILVSQVWSELRSSVRQEKQGNGRMTMRWVVLLAVPYIVFIGWAVASLIVSLKPPVLIKLEPFVFCSDQGPTHHIPVRSCVGPFAIVLAIVAIVYEILVGTLLLSRAPESISGPDRPSVWSAYQNNATVHIYVRLLLFNVLQLGPLIITVMSRINTSKTGLIKIDAALQILEALYPLVMFLLFASQKNILQTWRILPRPYSPARKMSLF